MICIIDYGIGNLAAIHNMLRRLGIESRISGDPDVCSSADKLILPGVGAYDEGMRNLEQCGLIGPLTEMVREKGKPLLGICLGMQLLGEGSDEGKLPGLGWFPMRFKRFATDVGQRTKSLHMGWNEVLPAKDSPLFEGYDRTLRFYFVHGYYAVCNLENVVLGKTTHGVEFASVVGRDNIVAVQFHPEKSHRFGMQLFRNFAEQM